jgi:hypothetical protein
MPIGFGVSFFQIPWAEEHGAFEVFGVEAASVDLYLHLTDDFLMVVNFQNCHGPFFPSYPSTAAERSCDTGMSDMRAAPSI